MIERTFDVQKMNDVVNHPSVYPWVHGPIVGYLDLAPIVENRDNFCLFGEYGGTIFTFMQPGIYELHTQVVPEGRGPWTLHMLWDSFRYMFTHTDAMEIMTRVPKGNLGALAAARACKFIFEFERPLGWVFDHKYVPAKVFSLKVQDWMREAPGLEEAGEEFHNALLKEYKKAGFKAKLHDEDKNHDRYVGAAFEMVKNGQPYKGAILYNRWAKLSGYKEISILKAEPVIMDISEALLIIQDGELRVVSCQSDLQLED